MANMKRLPKGTKMHLANLIREEACKMLGVEDIISELTIRHVSIFY